MYYTSVIAADQNNELVGKNGVFGKPLIVDKERHSDDAKSKWPLRVKMMNLFYKFYRMLYVCFIFYFIPMFYLVVNEANILAKLA